MSQTTTMTVRISGALSEFVASNVGENGSYENISEYVRDLIRRDRMRHEAIAEIQAAVDVGLASGPASPLDREAFKSRMRAGHAGK